MCLHANLTHEGVRCRWRDTGNWCETGVGNQAGKEHRNTGEKQNTGNTGEQEVEGDKKLLTSNHNHDDEILVLPLASYSVVGVYIASTWGSLGAG